MYKRQLLLLAMVLHAVPVLRLRDLLANTWRPLLATVVMVTAISCLPDSTALPAALRLAIQVTLGGAVYVVAVLLSWRLSGCGKGAESYLLHTLHMSRRTRRLLRSGWRLHKPPSGARADHPTRKA